MAGRVGAALIVGALTLVAVPSASAAVLAPSSDANHLAQQISGQEGLITGARCPIGSGTRER